VNEVGGESAAGDQGKGMGPAGKSKSGPAIGNSASMAEGGNENPFEVDSGEGGGTAGRRTETSFYSKRRG